MKISIITICYNSIKEIERTIRSVLNQTFKDLEYIIVDGASIDGTPEKAKEILMQYSNRYTRLISEPDKGIYDAMNKGIKASSGEWLCMMNAGDVFTNENVLTEVFSNSIPENISFLYSDFYKATSFDKYFRVHTCCEEHNKVLVHQSTIYKRSLHEEHGYYAVTPKLIVSDYLFFLRIPVEQTMKVNTVIAKYEGGGVSEQGGWAHKQALCANVTFRHTPFWSVYWQYFKWRVKISLPKRIREIIRLKMSGVENV